MWSQHAIGFPDRSATSTGRVSLHPFTESLLNLRWVDVSKWLKTDNKEDDYFFEQPVIHDYLDAGQCERFRYEHCRFVSFFRSSRAGELFGVVSTTRLRWDT